ncbi:MULTISPECIES: hypothetical protein [Haloferax]|uniref:Pentapeptide repeat-containing protein n=2 Tax=Haloferax TaxID=2251 RepID=A0A6G1Z0R2_9EURY|nr:MULTISPECIES: hypothetical protein [Haloferax]KAB1187478.1 hypothetical protein Hfx1149_05310 [Haloferax sp. CBA1149]MRW80130.1 hypothetical protein [Haloferax marinisediminis]
MGESLRCAYEHDVGSDGSDHTQTADESVWQCPHPASDETDYCLFHTAIEDKDTDVVTAALVEAINDPDQPSTFIGAQFDALDLAGERLGGDDAVDLREVIVRNDIDLSEATIETPLQLDAASVGGTLSMQRLETSGDISCRHLQTAGQWLLFDARIGGRLDAFGFSGTSLVATGVNVGDGISVRKGTVDEQVDFTQATVDGPVWLSHTDIGGHLDTGAAVYHDRLSLAHCRVEGDVALRDSTVEAELLLDHLHVCGTFDATNLHVAHGVDAKSSQFDGEVDFTEFTATGGHLEFGYARFDAAVYFDAVTIDSTHLSFQNAHFSGGTVSFVRAAITGTLTLSGARFTPESPFRMVETRVGRNVVCDHVSFGGEVYWNALRVNDNVDFSDCTVTALEFGVEIGGRLDFAYTYVSARAGFTETVVRGPARFTSARFDSEPSLTDATLEGDVAAYDVSVQSPETR